VTGPWAHTLAACDVVDALAAALNVQADAVAATVPSSGDCLGLRSLASELSGAVGYLRRVATAQPRPEGDS